MNGAFIFALVSSDLDVLSSAASYITDVKTISSTESVQSLIGSYDIIKPSE